MGTILKQMDWYSALQNMIAKSTDPNGIEIASSYQSVVQDSMKESPFFLVYGRDPRLPTSTLLEQLLATYPIRYRGLQD